MNWLLAAVFSAVMLALVLSRPRLVRGQSFTLFRSLWPSWRFFESIAPVATLSVRVVESPEQPGPWVPALLAPPRAWYALFVNPAGNLHLAYTSVVERLVQELDGQREDAAAELVTYQLVRRICEAALPRAEGAQGYQFQLQDRDTQETLFVSPVHAWD